MRADRLLSILLYLQNYGKMTSGELAEKLEVSERTIIRDMEALSLSGVPVYAERGSRGGWRLADGYRTNLTGMKAGELISLIISNQPVLLQDLGIREQYEAALQKLLAASPSAIRENIEFFRQKIHIDGAGWHEAAETFPYLATVQEAVWAERKLRIHYRRGQETVIRTVCPLGLVAKRSVWYFIAECEGDIRTYRISRIVHAEMLEESFPRPEDFNLAQYWEQSSRQFKQHLPSYPAVVRMDETLLSRMQRERFVRVLHAETEAAGTVKAAIDFETLEHACETVLRFGSSVEVVSPPELQAKVLSEAQAIVDRYRSGSRL